ncbi:hypothetical protein [Lentzea tibetensis]|uniref:hypothetical protein n=1 Tax=Lentzea tibetensis TaxID=2591470 RepID=UPI001C995FB9|nr:hypothetical protein [Lentzea tibetensis]
MTFGLMVRALLADVPKKNSWRLAEHAGLATPRPFEHLLDGAVWDAEVLRIRCVTMWWRAWDRLLPR